MAYEGDRSVKHIVVCSVLASVAIVTCIFQSSRSTPIHVAQKRVLANSIGMQLIRIPTGAFKMGSDKAPNSVPIHTVELREFWIGKYEVTNAQFERFRKRRRPVESRADNQPVTRVSFDEAAQFCRWLSKKEARRYRLPTEAEWEYAARGGRAQNDWPWGNEPPEGHAALMQPATKPIGSFSPNGYGLFDMSGNVEEWTADWYGANYYAKSPRSNPTGPRSGDFRVMRGGSFCVQEGMVWQRSPTPTNVHPTLNKTEDVPQHDGSGFRVVCEKWISRR
jgi:formylglycine-generating enzyme required for sulfatase activity